MTIKYKSKPKPELEPDKVATALPYLLPPAHVKPPSSAVQGRLPKLMPAKEAAALLRISVSTLRRMVTARALPVYHVGGRLMFELFDLSSYLDQRRVGAL